MMGYDEKNFNTKTIKYIEKKSEAGNFYYICDIK